MARMSKSTYAFVGDRRAIRLIVTVLCIAQLYGLHPWTLNSAMAQDTGQVLSEDDLMDLVDSLKAELEYVQVRNILSLIIKDPQQNEDVVRQAFRELIFLEHSQSGRPAAISAVRDALNRFPDLDGSLGDVPSYVAGLCDSLRTVMFGALSIPEPPECHVFLDGEPRGVTPLEIEHVPVGNVELLVTREGYDDYRRTITIEAGRVWNQLFVLEEERSVWWWLTRVGVGAVAVVGSILVLSGSDDGAPGAETLPGPPDPPGLAGGT